jgi:hypothetical protein
MAMFEKHKAEKAAEAHQAAVAAWTEQRDGYAHMLEVAKTFPGAATDEIMLSAGEGLFYKVTGTSLVEDRKGQGHYQGGSAGVSIPIGKVGGRPVRYRVGANRGHYVQAPPVATAVDTGTVFITNKRVIFAGAKATRECAFAKLIGFQHDDNAGSTTFSVSNRQKPTTVHYGPAISANFDFRLDLALAHFKGTLDELVAQLTADVAQIESERPAAPVTAAT